MKRNRMKMTIMAVLFSAFLGGCAGCGGCKEQSLPAEIKVPVHTPTLSVMESITVTKEPTMTPIPMEEPILTVVPSLIPTAITLPTATVTPVPTATILPTATPIPTLTATPTVPPVFTTPATPTATPIPTVTATLIPTLSPTPELTPTSTATPKPTATPTPALVNGIGVGEYVTFGRYEQDNNLDNGPEPIEWLVLEIKEGKAFLLARYGLDQHSYHVRSWMSDEPNDPDFDRPVEVTWETCEMRLWLNTTFMNIAFSMEEQEDIVATRISNPASKYGYDGGNDTIDKVYLMSGEETRRYLGQEEWINQEIKYCNEKAYTQPTAYAIAQGVEAVRHKAWYDGNCQWWVRTLGQGTNWAGMISFDGGYNEGGRYVTGGLAVRPVTWIDLESEFVGKVN